VEKDAEGLANMHKLAEIIGWLGSAMEPHLDSFPRKSGHVQIKEGQELINRTFLTNDRFVRIISSCQSFQRQTGMFMNL